MAILARKTLLKKSTFPFRKPELIAFFRSV